ncbi:MAG: hypothetical protein Q9180_005443 [Flavoplaca navasiana]
MAGQATKERQKGCPKAWLPQAGGIPLDSPFAVQVIAGPTVRRSLTIDLEVTPEVCEEVCEARADATVPLWFWKEDVESLFSLLNDRLASFSARSSTETDDSEHSPLPLNVGVPNFAREVEQLSKKVEGWYDDLNDVAVTLKTNHCQQLQLQPNQHNHHEIVWWQPEQLRQIQQRMLEPQIGVRTKAWGRELDSMLEEILDDSNMDSEIDEDSRES